MKRSSERFLTTHVGSMVRPPKITQYFQRLAAKEAVDTPAFESELSSAVAEVVKHRPRPGWTSSATENSASRVGCT